MTVTSQHSLLPEDKGCDWGALFITSLSTYQKRVNLKWERGKNLLALKSIKTLFKEPYCMKA